MEGTCLVIDLSNRSFEGVALPEGVIRRYIGGRGLGSYLLYKNVPAGANPLGEENCLIFTAGPASGTGLFYTPKANLNTKSPLTGIYLYSISSGILAEQMRRAGYWAIVIKGIADKPTYLEIRDDRVKFWDASHLWGMETAAVQKEMLKGADPRKVATVGIGPAGERKIPSAAVFTDGRLYRCFGRGGAGAVMGSKNLKGLLVSGTGQVPIGDPERLSSVRKRMAELLKTDLKGWADWWRAYETASDLGKMNELGILPTRNWQGGQFEGWRGIDKSTTPMGWPEKGRACGPNCPTPGCREVEVKKGLYKGARSDFEWETIYAFGSQCGVDRMEPIVAASQICDEAGVDTMTAGTTIGFAMECFERGLLTPKDMDGLELRFGNDGAMITALKKLVRQEGFGKRLAMGTRRLSSEIKGSEAFAMQVKGMELGGYECRGLNGQALQFAVDNRGGCHHGYGLPARMEVFDDTRLQVKGKGDYVRRAAISRIVRDSMIVCTFTPLYEEEMVAEVLSASFGREWSLEELEEVGERIVCQERLFNMREGIDAKADTLPERLLKEPKPDGPTEGAVVPLEELKEDYYRALGYDPSTGNPTDAVLEKLGLEK